jgi:hypothetical protein
VRAKVLDKEPFLERPQRLKNDDDEEPEVLPGRLLAD